MVERAGTGSSSRLTRVPPQLSRRAVPADRHGPVCHFARQGIIVLRGKLPGRPFLAVTAVFIILIAIAVVSYLRTDRPTEATPVAFSQFLADVEANHVKAVTVDADALSYLRRDGSRFETVAPHGYVASNPTFVTSLMDRGVTLDVSRAESSRAGSYGALGVALLFFAVAGLAPLRGA